MQTRVLAFVLAGGEGTRLYPLTAEHAKPALPFLNGFRLVDFVLSNLTLSQITPIYVLAQHKPRSLIEHVHDVWGTWSKREDAPISVVLPCTHGNNGSFKGTADAVYQNLDLVKRHRPDLVAVFAADHVYRMDVRHMVSFHEQRDADFTVAAVRVPVEQSSSFGILQTSPTGELLGFQEKPEHATPIPGEPAQAYASMGNYLFRPSTLIELLEEASRRGGTDFGFHVLPRLPRACRAYAYDFSSNAVPGIKPHEERSYWRDVGTQEAYAAAQRDAQGLFPRFDLANSEWPIQPGKPWPRAPQFAVRKIHAFDAALPGEYGAGTAL
ncbi:MAG: sugar phosphate nucleotidyltransferase [Georgfuchsia sp.]